MNMQFKIVIPHCWHFSSLAENYLSSYLADVSAFLSRFVWKKSCCRFLKDIFCTFNKHNEENCWNTKVIKKVWTRVNWISSQRTILHTSAAMTTWYHKKCFCKLLKLLTNFHLYINRIKNLSIHQQEKNFLKMCVMIWIFFLNTNVWFSRE